MQECNSKEEKHELCICVIIRKLVALKLVRCNILRSYTTLNSPVLKDLQRNRGRKIFSLLGRIGQRDTISRKKNNFFLPALVIQSDMTETLWIVQSWAFPTWVNCQLFFTHGS